MNIKDEIVEEVRAARQAYAARFQNQIAAMAEDLILKQNRHRSRIADLRPVESTIQSTVLEPGTPSKESR